MEWAEDIKFSIKKTTAKMGRRAGNNSTSQNSIPYPSTPETISSPEINLESNLESTDIVSNQGPPRRRSGGWAESATKARSIHKTSSEDERFTKTSEFNKTTEDDIPIIPDLDDIQDELLMNDATEPPSITVNRVVTLKELNSDLLNQKVFSSLEDADLSILTKCLQPQTNFEDEDIIWEWEKLFTEVTAEINSEKPSGSVKNSNAINNGTAYNEEIIQNFT